MRARIFKAGDAVGGLVVLGIEESNPKAALTVYRVRYDCPSAREVIAWHERATEIVRARRSV